MTYKQVKNICPEDFKRLCGVRPETFAQMVEVVRTHTPPKKKTGRPNTRQPRRPVTNDFRILERVPHLLSYCSVLGSRWVHSLSNCTQNRRYLEPIKSLHSSRQEAAADLGLPARGSSDRCDRNSDWTPKKNQKRFYSGKKKRHTLKSQVIVDQATQVIICTAHGTGREHDFRLFKNSKTRFKGDIECLADKGYQGIQKLHANSRTPVKKQEWDWLECPGQEDESGVSQT